MASKPPAPTLICQVCGTENPASREFCRKCAADLRAPVAGPDATVPAERSTLPTRTIAIVVGIAIVALALLVVGLLALGGGPTATPTPAPTATPGPIVSPASPTATPVPAETTEPTSTPEVTAAGTLDPSAKANLESITVPARADCNGDNGTGQVGMISVEWAASGTTGVRISIDPPSAQVAYDYGYQDYQMPAGSALVPFTCSPPNHDSRGDYHLYVVWTLHDAKTYAQYRFAKVYQSP